MAPMWLLQCMVTLVPCTHPITIRILYTTNHRYQVYQGNLPNLNNPTTPSTTHHRYQVYQGTLPNLDNPTP